MSPAKDSPPYNQQVFQKLFYETEKPSAVSASFGYPEQFKPKFRS
jgi:hypothetical protein